MSDSSSVQEIPTAQAAGVDALVSTAFGYKTPHRYFQDFPVWGSDAVKRFGLFHGGKLASHVGIRITEIGTTRVGLVGGVATDAHHRGHGLSSRLLEHVIEYGHTQKCEWLVLWGSEHAFYSKFGFNLTGVQTRIRLADLVPAGKPQKSVYMKDGYTPKIFDWLLAHRDPNSVTWRPSDRGWFEKHQTVKWFWIENPFTFVGFERGMDLPHIVHEWGGDPSGLPFLFRAIHRIDAAAEFLTHPAHLKLAGIAPNVPQVEELLCLAKSLLTPKSTWPERFWISGLNAC